MIKNRKSPWITPDFPVEFFILRRYWRCYIFPSLFQTLLNCERWFYDELAISSDDSSECPKELCFKRDSISFFFLEDLWIGDAAMKHYKSQDLCYLYYWSYDNWYIEKNFNVDHAETIIEADTTAFLNLWFSTFSYWGFWVVFHHK